MTAFAFIIPLFWCIIVFATGFSEMKSLRKQMLDARKEFAKTHDIAKRIQEDAGFRPTLADQMTWIFPEDKAFEAHPYVIEGRKLMRKWRCVMGLAVLGVLALVAAALVYSLFRDSK